MAPDGSHKILNALAITGAQVNSVRLGLFENVIVPANGPLRLVTLKGDSLPSARFWSVDANLGLKFPKVTFLGGVCYRSPFLCLLHFTHSGLRNP